MFEKNTKQITFKHASVGAKKKNLKQDKKNHKDTELTFITIYYI